MIKTLQKIKITEIDDKKEWENLIYNIKSGSWKCSINYTVF